MYKTVKTPVRDLYVVMREVDGLQSEEFRRECVGNEQEWSVLVEDVRIARSILGFEVEIVTVVANVPRRAAGVDQRYAEPIITVSETAGWYCWFVAVL